MICYGGRYHVYQGFRVVIIVVIINGMRGTTIADGILTLILEIASELGMYCKGRD